MCVQGTILGQPGGVLSLFAGRPDTYAGPHSNEDRSDCGDDGQAMSWQELKLEAHDRLKNLNLRSRSTLHNCENKKKRYGRTVTEFDWSTCFKSIEPDSLVGRRGTDSQG